MPIHELQLPLRNNLNGLPSIDLLLTSANDDWPALIAMGEPCGMSQRKLDLSPGSLTPPKRLNVLAGSITIKSPSDNLIIGRGRHDGLQAIKSGGNSRFFAWWVRPTLDASRIWVACVPRRRRINQTHPGDAQNGGLPSKEVNTQRREPEGMHYGVVTFIELTRHCWRSNRRPEVVDRRKLGAARKGDSRRPKQELLGIWRKAWHKNRYASPGCKGMAHSSGWSLWPPEYAMATGRRL
uniref:Uncharacterized protein n=1 Tax=Trichuris muris TaxID=70415 RepID=A0A5S6Q2E5_TRIMR